MSNDKIITFTNEDGEKINYNILDQVLICGSEYIAMTRVDSKKEVEIYKIKFDKDWNETLEKVEDEKGINMFKQVSKISI